MKLIEAVLIIKEVEGVINDSMNMAPDMPDRRQLADVKFDLASARNLLNRLINRVI